MFAKRVNTLGRNLRHLLGTGVVVPDIFRVSVADVLFALPTIIVFILDGSINTWIHLVWKAPLNLLDDLMNITLDNSRVRQKRNGSQSTLSVIGRLENSDIKTYFGPKGYPSRIATALRSCKES